MKRAALAILLLSGSAWDQTPPVSQILVSATGTAKTPPDTATAEENIALHNAVMQMLAENGGKVPDNLKG